MAKRLFIIITILFTVSCGIRQFPKSMPDDFKVEYHMDGGMVNEYTKIILQFGECIYEGRKNDSDFKQVIMVTDKADMESLYVSLKNINAFNLQFRTEKEVYDRGGESILYTINGKQYKVSNSGLDFIDKKDAGAFGKSIFLIKDFMDTFKDKYNKNDILTDTVKPEIIDSTIIEGDQPPGSGMPSDFTIQYDYEAGMTGDHQTIILKLGNCSDEGNKIGEEFHSKKWRNTDQQGFEKLYQDLEKLHAFDIKFVEKGQVYDRGGENLTYTMNGKKYPIKNAGNCFIEPSHQDAFKNSVKLILDYASKSSK